MKRPNRIRNIGIHPGKRGIKIPRKKKFEPVIPTLSGVSVRSQYEKICADYLYQHKINFRYEPLILLEGKQYRPDFFLTDHNIFIEICGYNHMPYYRDRVRRKIHLYRKHDLQTIFIQYNGNGSLKNIIARELDKAGIKPGVCDL